jgi:hypothetical protein
MALSDPQDEARLSWAEGNVVHVRRRVVVKGGETATAIADNDASLQRLFGLRALERFVGKCI